ncbi:hypothetical protein ILP97_18025 [Amycolatopsis sp. H6(2020)]|nr:hypothetical protein [Amycolatopsis sp. H6(2020)]
MVHGSHLPWKHIDHPSKVGQEVTAEILVVGTDHERVSRPLAAPYPNTCSSSAAERSSRHP